LKGLVIFGSPGEDSSSIVDVGIDDDEDGGISGARDLEFAQVSFELDVAQGEEERGVVIVEDLVRDAGAVDAANDLDIGTAIGFRKIAGESAIEWDGEQDLEKGSWDVVALEFDLVLVATLDRGCEDGVDCEQEEVMISGGGIRGGCFGRRRGHFHGTEASGHSFKAVVGKELELQEEEEAEERASRRDVLLVDKDKGLVGYEHLREFFV
jgi:hypothetical protein